MTALLEVSELRAGYGAVRVLRGIDFSVDEGEAVVILGANGAGKTTTLRALSGMIDPAGGIVFDGHSIVGRRTEQIAAAGIAHVPQGRGTIVDLTVDENLRIGAYLRRGQEIETDLDRWYTTFPRLKDRRSQQAGSMSGGEQQMLAVARALMSRPKLLLLDEPSLGLAPLVTQELFRTLGELNRKDGISMLVVEQNAGLALDIAARGYVLETGTIVTSGTAGRALGQRRRAPRVPGDLMSLFLTQVMNGIGSGAVYASLALALVLVYRTTGILNFAQGEMALYSTYLVWYFTELGVPVWLSILLSMTISFIGGALIERILIRPVENSSPLVLVIVTIGLFLAINSIAQVQFGNDIKLLPRAYANKTWLPGNVQISSDTLVLVGVLIAECAVLYLVLNRTKIGLAFRAVASNFESSRLVGVPVGRMLMLGWAMAAAIGALAGSLVIAPVGLQGASMQEILVYAFAAAALGGFDSPVGAVVGGLIVGVVGTLTTQYFHAVHDIELIVPFGLILVVLLVKPSGLFGTTRVERV